ncbi:hypothetical protein EOA23_10945 [Mesorhizobium sp. M2A.F.Ca.ET.042.01.1.1]|uniref:hypothetical protein n=1 Tax=Mesorhizobium sp. M2A.F.Ca.ET.042.01.1.1 TaxID=2496745 RepID=UPI000FCC67EA|nr:hypothetical protein [Mesorhizobium sp. M2A.F.Ca.ET.042.01.1.1]RUX31219.1 hypothetical protein EOA23_10945 [Mesorhizobium sp. M2A.F.Ca.ET.042.01.1.1]
MDEPQLRHPFSRSALALVKLEQFQEKREAPSDRNCVKTRDKRRLFSWRHDEAEPGATSLPPGSTEAGSAPQALPAFPFKAVALRRLCFCRLAVYHHADALPARAKNNQRLAE